MYKSFVVLALVLGIQAAPFTRRQAGADFGSCSTPEIRFAAGIDGRRETSFEPADKASFNHGSAQNIDIITRSICDTLTNSCDANQAAKDQCADAAAAASAATKGSGAQADAFNAEFGIQTDFVNVQQIDNQGRPTGTILAGGAADNAAADNNANDNAAADNANQNQNQNNNQNNNNNNNNNDNAAADNNAAAAAGNLQSFSGALGGIEPPAVTAGGRGFEVANNADFVNQKAALERSCAVQHNACANAANSGADFSVGDCDAQEAQCRAAA